MFGIKINIENDQLKETLNDVKTATAVSVSEFKKAYHQAKIRSFEESVRKLEELSKG